MSDSADINWYSNEAATFGDRVAAAREAQQMSQKALAKRLGVGLKTVEGWENDLSEPRANKLQMLAGILNVSMTWLLTGEGSGIEGEPAELEDAETAELLNELRMMRSQMLRSAERLGVIEKRLKAKAQHRPELAE